MSSANMNNTKISDIITEEEIKRWRYGDVVTIKANTGDGKSWWCMNTLYCYAEEHNQKILFLIPRVRCKDQFEKELEKYGKLGNGIINIITYQTIEKAYQYKRDIGLNSYDYIVCDESHYFTNDSQFNRYCDVSFKEILKTKAIKIYMSATIDFTIKYLKMICNVKTINYELPLHYDNFKEAIYYTKEESLYLILDILTKIKDKTIVFINNTEKCMELAKRYNGAFICGENNKNYKYSNKEEIINIIEQKHFESNLLFTTQVLDIGITLKDRELKNIIIDGIYNIDTIKQILGRKRSIDRDDVYDNLYIFCPNNCFIGGQLTKYSKEVARGEYLYRYGSDAYIEEFSRARDYVNCIYDDDNGNKELNTFMYCNYILEKTRYNEILDCGGFGKYITKELNLKESNIRYTIFENVIEVSSLEAYLRMNLGKRLYKEQQKELIDRINLKDNRGRLQKSINILNQYLIDNFDMILSSKKFRVDGKLKTVWILSKLK